jgi:hypothetical protein
MSSASRRRRGFVAVVGASMLVLTLALPASASMFTRERYSGSDAFSYDDCGFVVDVTVEFGGVFQIRTGTGDDASAFFAHDNYWYRETHVRESDGKTFVVSGNGNFIETKAVRIEGSIFTFTAVNAGQLFTIRDADGHVVLRDRGAIIGTILFDTTGDDVPGGDFLGVLDETFHGGFPSFDADLCAIWND